MDDISSLNQSIRVLHVLVCLGGGIDLLNLQKELPKHIHFDYLVCHTASCDKEATERGSTVHVMPPEMQSPLKWATLVGKLVKEHRYNVVHFHRFAFGGSVLRAAKRAGASVRIGHSHCTLLQESCLWKKLIYYPYHWTVNRFLLARYATNIFGCSSNALRFLMGPLWKGNKCRVILNGIPIDSFVEKMRSASRQELCKQYGVPENVIVIGNIGRLEPVKNQMFLLKISKLLAEREYEKAGEKTSTMIIGGAGSLHTELKRKAKRLQQENRIFLPGHCTNTPAMFGNLFDCFVLPSKAEGFGIVILEAIAAGLYVVCSDTIPQDVTAAFSERITSLSLSAPLEHWADAVEDAIQKKITMEEGIELVKKSPMNFQHFAHEIIKTYEKSVS